jgi:hypothetical protein
MKVEPAGDGSSVVKVDSMHKLLPGGERQGRGRQSQGIRHFHLQGR